MQKNSLSEVLNDRRFQCIPMVATVEAAKRAKHFALGGDSSVLIDSR
jgi:hypothetical protein